MENKLQELTNKFTRKADRGKEKRCNHCQSQRRRGNCSEARKDTGIADQAKEASEHKEQVENEITMASPYHFCIKKKIMTW